MSVIQFKKAVKYDARGRVAMIGPAGSGKSYSALLLARLLAGPGGKIAAIDTEHGSLSKYADLVDFDTLEFGSYTPENFLDALTAAEQAKYDVFVCDSLSHFWMGKDGALEFVDERKKRSSARGGDQMEGWKDWRPHERMMIDRMIASPCHVIATMRTKNEYRDEEYTNSRGEKKTKRVKVGLAPVQRDGLEYEFDLVGLMTDENDFIIDKTRCPDYSGKVLSKPGAKDFEPFRDWLKGAKRETPAAAAAQPAAVNGSANGNGNGNHAAPAWDWRVVLPAFERIEAQVGHDRFVAMLGASGYTKLEELGTRENAAKLYKALLAEIELFGVDPQPAAPVQPAQPVPVPVSVPPAPVAAPVSQPAPIPKPAAQGMPPEVEDLWRRITSVASICTVFSELKQTLNELTSMDTAEEIYRATLSKFGVQSSNGFRNLGVARQCASALWEQVQALKTQSVPFDEGRAA
jgi:energy-coupling factor transporter ATP-binding protein EcfA2